MGLYSIGSMSFLSVVLTLAPTANAMTQKSDAMGGKTPRIEVGVDARVELLSIVFRIAGAEEYQRGRVPAYSADVDSYFGPFAEHRAVRRVVELRQRYRISHDAVVKLAVHVDDATTLSESVSLTDTGTLGSRWQPEIARAFLEDLRVFANDTDFARFIDQHQELYRTTEARLEKQIESDQLAWLDEYFGEASRSLQIIPGMLTGRASYGATVVRDSGKDRYAIVGVETVDGSGVPEFDGAVVEAIVHELCHSYLRPILEDYSDDLRDAGVALYLSERSKMESQAYRSGSTVMNETLTRACTHRYLKAKVGAEAVEGDLIYNRSRGFVWIADVSRLLEIYEANRVQYSTFADFAPELTKFFANYTSDLPDSADKEQAGRPHVVKVVPANGATDVDPALEAIEVTFDRPMRADAWSVVGGGPKYPDTDTPAYDPARRVFRLPVKLEPNRDYELWLNRGQYESFASAEGVPLAPFRVAFRTRSR